METKSFIDSIDLANHFTIYAQVSGGRVSLSFDHASASMQLVLKASELPQLVAMLARANQFSEAK